MKIKQVLVLIILIAGIFACTSDNKVSMEDPGFDKYFFNEKNIPVVKGKVLNLSKDELENTSIEYALETPFAQSQIVKTGKLDSDGTFELEIDYPFPNQQIWLTVGKFFYAGIYANKELYIELNADSLRIRKAYMNAPGVKYLGADGELNTIMNNRVLYKAKELRSVYKEVNKLVYDKNADIDSIIAKYDSLYAILHKLDNDYIAENPSPYSYLIKNKRMSDYFGGLLRADNAGKMNSELFDKIKNHKAYLISSETSDFYKRIYNYVSFKLDNSEYLGNGRRLTHILDIDHENLKDYTKISTEDRELIEEIIHQKQLKNDHLPYDTLGFMELSIKTYDILKDTVLVAQKLKEIHYIDSTFSKGKADMLRLRFSSNKPKEEKLILEAVLANTDTRWCKSLIEKEANKNAKKLAGIEQLLKAEKSFQSGKNIGKPLSELSCGAKLYTVDDLGAEDLLSNLKLAFENKALILDFWGTWCPPCLADLPNSKKLHDQLKDEPVEFVYLCTSAGSSIDKWKEKIAELELAGTHLFVNATIESNLMGLFSFSGFPSYAFINAQGKYKAGAIRSMSTISKDELLRLMTD
jgi:thiol-disulfide isomerase/thioredoxin